MHTDNKPAHDGAAQRQRWQQPTVRRLEAGAAEQGSGTGLDGAEQVQS